MPIFEAEGYFGNPWYYFLEEVTLFQEKTFSSVKTKTNPSFAVKFAETSKHSFSLSI